MLDLNNVAYHETGEIAVGQYSHTKFRLRRQEIVAIGESVNIVFHIVEAETDQMDRLDGPNLGPI